MGLLIEEAVRINDSGFRGRTDSETLYSKSLLEVLGDRWLKDEHHQRFPSVSRRCFC